jgi:hypothetical protein
MKSSKEPEQIGGLIVLSYSTGTVKRWEILKKRGQKLVWLADIRVSGSTTLDEVQLVTSLGLLE